MKINTLIEREDGSAEFTAELTDREVHMLTEIGMNVLIRNGMQIIDTANRNIVSEPEGVQ